MALILYYICGKIVIKLVGVLHLTTHFYYIFRYITVITFVALLAVSEVNLIEFCHCMSKQI